ncbi:hypothetical protein P261_01861 [Lachnospiraceae bacterium TWA4]|nr:hypothetical protein P261_01861 [Lachnospiraceae bacterium TWA4]
MPPGPPPRPRPCRPYRPCRFCSPFAPPGRPPFGPGPGRPFRLQSFEEDYKNFENIKLEYEYMKEYYPVQVRWIHLFVEDAVTEFQYENSFIFDEYPERERIYRMTEIIYQRILSEIDERNMKAWEKEDDDTQYWGYDDDMCMKDLIQVLLLHEIFCRRIKR